MTKEHIKVFARIRASGHHQSAIYSVKELKNGNNNLILNLPKPGLNNDFKNNEKPQSFRFDKVFADTSSQEEIFSTVALPIINKVLAGYNATILAYGQNGSGKTYTINGKIAHYSERGILPRTLYYIFQHLQSKAELYRIFISYVEIHNENAYDLLDIEKQENGKDNSPKVIIMEDCGRYIRFKNAILSEILSPEEGLRQLLNGYSRRMFAKVANKGDSTGSHTIFTIYITTKTPKSANIRRSSLQLVDLAGSGRWCSNKIVAEEKLTVNWSLQNLQSIIHALSEKKVNCIPFHNSLLTSLLMDSFGGNCLTAMVVALCPKKLNNEDCIQDCQFAQSAAKIVNHCSVNEETDVASLVNLQNEEIQRLKRQLHSNNQGKFCDKLSEEDVKQCHNSVKYFLTHADVDIISLIGMDVRKIKECFNILKAQYSSLLVREQIRNNYNNIFPSSSFPTIKPQLSTVEGNPSYEIILENTSPVFPVNCFDEDSPITNVFSPFQMPSVNYSFPNLKVADAESVEMVPQYSANHFSTPVYPASEDYTESSLLNYLQAPKTTSDPSKENAQIAGDPYFYNIDANYYGREMTTLSNNLAKLTVAHPYFDFLNFTKLNKI